MSLSLGAKKATERNAHEIEMCHPKDELRVEVLVNGELRQFIMIDGDNSCLFRANYFRFRRLMQKTTSEIIHSLMFQSGIQNIIIICVQMR